MDECHWSPTETNSVKLGGTYTRMASMQDLSVIKVDRNSAMNMSARSHLLDHALIHTVGQSRQLLRRVTRPGTDEDTASELTVSEILLNFPIVSSSWPRFSPHCVKVHEPETSS